MAIDLFDEVVALQGRNGPQIDAGVCGAAISACERNGQWHEALRVLKQVQALCKPRSHGKERRKLLEFPAVVSAMRACRKGKQAELAASLLNFKKLDITKSLNARQKTILTNLAAATLLESDSGKWHSALKLLTNIERHHWTSVTYTTALQCYS